MPYKSNAQRRYFHYLESKGKMPKEEVDEWDQASKGDDLPEYVNEGGYVGHGNRAFGHSSEPIHTFYGGEYGGYPDIKEKIHEKSMGHYADGGRVLDHSAEEGPSDYKNNFPRAKYMNQGGRSWGSNYIPDRDIYDWPRSDEYKRVEGMSAGGKVLDHSNIEGPSEYKNNWPRAQYMNEGGRTFDNEYAPNRSTFDWPRGDLYESKGMHEGGKVLNHSNEEDKHTYGNNRPYSKYMNRGGILNHADTEGPGDYSNNVPDRKYMESGAYQHAPNYMYLGGQAMGPETFDEDTGNPKHFNSAGEPHTSHKYEEEWPEEYEGFGKIPGQKKVNWPGKVKSLEATGRSGHGNRDATSDGPLSTDRAFGKALKKRRLYSTSPG
jgi:hypothetical protein